MQVPDASGLDFIPPSHSGPIASFVIAILVFGVGGGAGIVWMFLRARGLSKVQAREHEALVHRAAAALFPGPGRVVHGVIAGDDARTPAVRVEIVQSVKNHTSKNSSWHTWDETSRSVAARPFYLTRDDGEIVYVEPTNDILVVDALERVYPQNRPGVRLRVADARQGESFYAYGNLHRAYHPRAAGDAYRGGGTGMVLRPPSRGRMLLATDAIRDRYSAQIAFLWRWGAAFAVVWALLNAFFSGPFVEAVLLGRVEKGELTSHRIYMTRNKNSTTTHYELTVQGADGFVLARDVPADTYYSSVPWNGELTHAATVPLLRTGDSTRASFLGERPSMSTGWLSFSVVGLAFAVGLTFVQYRQRAAWYDRRKLDERGGSGHWREVRPQAAVDPQKE